MKIKASRLTALAMTALLTIVSGCSGSNSGGGNTAANNSSTGNKPAATEGASGSTAFNLWLGWKATINNDSLVQKYWREQEPGVDVKLEATQGDAMTALNLKINTGGFEDAAIFSRNETVKSAMRRSKQVMPVEQYFDMPDKYPGLAAIPKQYLELMKDEDGHIWSIPTWFDQNPEEPWPGWASQGWFVRTDVLEKAGMTTADLTTLEGIETFLKKPQNRKTPPVKRCFPCPSLWTLMIRSAGVTRMRC